MFTVSERWQNAYPGAAAGVLAMRNVVNPAHNAALDERKSALEAALRARYADQDRTALATTPTIQAYNAYYGRYRKTYHVLLQLESVALKGRTIPRAAALVEAMFMAELQNQLLTAGHDVSALDGPVQLDVAAGTETYTLLNGKEQTLSSGDMCMFNRRGILSSVLYGPDQRSRITSETQEVLFVVYAPAGIGEAAVAQHLRDIRDYVLVIAPGAEVSLLPRPYGVIKMRATV